MTAEIPDGPRPSSVEWMLEIFDVVPGGPGRFVGTSDGGARRVVDGSQLLGQAMVAAAKSLPTHRVRSAHAVFTRVVDDVRPVHFAVDVTHDGRTTAATVVGVEQGDRRCATVSVLLDVPGADVVRHAAARPAVDGPGAALPQRMPMAGRELRIVGVPDPNDPDDVGPPELDAWVRFDPVPGRPELACALVAHFTGHLAISTTMRAHPGIGTAVAHRSVSTAVLTITVSFHEPFAWDGWLLYHHESTSAGSGMSYVRGQVFTEEGALIASFAQEGMIRAFADGRPGSGLPVEARL